MKNTKKILCKFGVATMIFGTFFQGLCATTQEFFTAEQIADPAWATAIQRTMEVKAMTDEQDPVYNTVDRQFDACSYNIYAIERDLKNLPKQVVDSVGEMIHTLARTELNLQRRQHYFTIAKNSSSLIIGIPNLAAF